MPIVNNYQWSYYVRAALHSLNIASRESATDPNVGDVVSARLATLAIETSRINETEITPSNGVSRDILYVSGNIEAVVVPNPFQPGEVVSIPLNLSDDVMRDVQTLCTSSTDVQHLIIVIHPSKLGVAGFYSPTFS